MSLSFILGPAGSGKTTRLYDWLIEESMAHPEQMYYCIVPEQFTMLTQQQLVRRHPRGGIMNIDVLSFQRLAWRVARERGDDRKTVLTETGKNLILRKLSSDLKDELPALGSMLERQGYVTMVKSILSEFSQYAVRGEELDAMIESAAKRPALQAKLKDIRRLQEAFEAYKAQRFITAEETLEILAQNAADSQMLRGVIFAFDAFTGFTPMQMEVLRSLMKTAGEIRIALTLDDGMDIYAAVREHELFALTRRTIQALMEMAAEEKTEILPPERMTGISRRFVPGGELSFLERRLLRDGKCAGYIPQTDRESTQEISLHCFSSPAQEAAFAAQTAYRLIYSEGYRPGEIAVIAGKLSVYERHLARALTTAKLPYFMDRLRPVDLNPALEVIRAGIMIADRGYSYESVMRLLRTGFTQIDTEGIDRLENYLLARGIRGRTAWHETWESPSQYIKEEELPGINASRQIFTDLTDAAMEDLLPGKNTVSRYIRGIRRLLQDTGTFAKLKESAEQFRTDAARRSLAMEYDQIGEVITQILDETEQLLGPEMIRRREFSLVLEAGFEQARVGLIPPGVDQIYIGNMERTRLENVRAVIFTGMNDAYVPAQETKGSILPDRDRSFLLREGFHLAPDRRENAYAQRFYQYLCLTKPSDRLYITYAAGDMKGGQLRASYLVSHILKLFPGKTVAYAPADPDTLAAAMTLDSCFAMLAGRLRCDEETLTDQTKEMLRFFLGQNDYAQRAQRYVRSALTDLRQRNVQPGTMKLLGTDHFTTSISRMETYAACPAWYYAGYVCSLHERERHRIEAADLGTLMHTAMQIFSARLSSDPDRSWRDISQDDWQKLLDESLRSAEELTGKGLFASNARGASLFLRAQRIMRRSVWGILERIRAGRFTPALFEQTFFSGAGNETQLFLRGQIDRIDLAEDAGTVYVKVIDYKTGSKEFSFADLYDGRALQLPVYMREALALAAEAYPGRKIVPAGMFYVNIADPVITGSAADIGALAGEPDAQRQAQIRQEMLQALRPKGVLETSDPVLDLYASDRTLLPWTAPVTLRKDLTPSARPNLLAQGKIEEISSFALRKLSSFADAVRQGELAPHPYQKGSRKACEWCRYRDVCAFDKTLPGAAYRQGTNLNDKQILEKLRQEGSDG